MIIYVAIIAICSVLYLIKGGQHGFIFNEIRAMNPIINRILDGKVLSSIGFGVLTGSFISALAWLAGVAPAMGRIVDGIGGYKSDNSDIEQWKLGLQRGVFMGAMLTLTTSNIWFIVMGATFPITAWVGTSIEQFIKKSKVADWHYHELLFGAAIGCSFLLRDVFS